MNWSDVIYLGNEVVTENDMGDVIREFKKRKVFANKLSVRQSEFYQAQATGLKPEKAFEIRSIEYDDDEIVEYEGKTYTIIRTFDKGEFIELICEGGVNRGNA